MPIKDSVAFEIPFALKAEAMAYPGGIKPTNPKHKKTDIPVPEPRHRVGPKGVSSGISFRNLPQPSLDEIKKICEHYQEKCSGTYKSLASRYVYQMATEIEDLVDVMQGDSSGSEASFPYLSRSNTNARGRFATKAPSKSSSKENVNQAFYSSRHNGSSKRSAASSSKSGQNAPLRNISSNQNSRPNGQVTNEKDRRRWRKELQSAHPEVVIAAEKNKWRREHKSNRLNRRHEESICSSTSSFSDDENSCLHFAPLPNHNNENRIHLEGQKDDVLRSLVEESSKPNGLDGHHHDDVLKWLKDEMDRRQYLLKRSKHLHAKELDNAKKELEKVKKAAKIVIKAVRKRGEEKAAKLEANVQSERRQRVKSQRIVQSLIKSQSDQLKELKQVNHSVGGSWDVSSADLCDLMGDSDLTSVLDELAEEAFQQSYCS